MRESIGAASPLPNPPSPTPIVKSSDPNPSAPIREIQPKEHRRPGAKALPGPPIEIRCTVPAPRAVPKGGSTYLNRISADIAIEYEDGFKNQPLDCGSTADDVVDAVLFVNSNPGLPSASPSVAKGQDQMAPAPHLGEIDGDRLVFPDVFIPVPGAPVDPENPPAQCAEGEPSPSNPGACFPPETVLRIFNVQLDPEPNIRLKVTVFPEGSTATEERIQIPQVCLDSLRITRGSAAAEDIGRAARRQRRDRG